MSSLTSLLLLLFLCAFPFGETVEKFTPIQNPRFSGRRSRQLASLLEQTPGLWEPVRERTRGQWERTPGQWERTPPCLDKKPGPEAAEQTARLALLCPPEESPGQVWRGLCPTQSQLVTGPQGGMLVEQEKDLSAYNWNSFGLRYGKRHAGVLKARLKIW
ncbi:metastasis-suppressor KiSS-1 [Ornithorhynchus anatinus]|uniref:KiSS-1 metastasis suppressor n=1 Tax=Ornithorhynchus anatinus TaxID=9258 RepID=F6U9S5_ORNAN|nr:metastasis-suppressor KiSS-1 [Ornithorhynchus anatinus]